MSLLRNKKNLVITIGDSWTFGDSLGTIYDDPFVDDFQARYTQCYGRCIADKLDADWYNFGLCGGGNFSILHVAFDWLLNHNIPFLTQENYAKIKDASWPEHVHDGVTDPLIYKELLEVHCKSNWNPDQVNIKNYDNVYVFITLTETGRDYPRIKQLNDTIPNRIEEYLHFEETSLYNLIAELKKHSSHPIIVGRNFSVDLPSTTNSQLDVNQNWIEINYQYNKIHNQGSDIDLSDILRSGPLSGVGFHNLEKSTEFVNFKEFFVNQVNSADKCWTWLRNNPLNRDRATCHPTKESHKLWADYLLSHLSI
jgi:hypothetical protein